LAIFQINIWAIDGHFLTAVNGGGLGDSLNKYPIHTNATSIGPWEKFRVVMTDTPTSVRQAIRTYNGNYLTAVGGGGRGHVASNPYEPTTIITTKGGPPGPDEFFNLVEIPDGMCAFQTRSGNYVSAVNGGGLGDSEGSWPHPIHTNATQITANETFLIVYISDS
jgi:hypothetical protein